MARVFTTGFETGDYLDFDTCYISGLSVVTSPVRSGTYAGQLYNTDAGYFGQALATPVSELFARAGFRTSTVVLSQQPIITFRLPDNTFVGLEMNGQGKLQVSRNGIIIEVSTGRSCRSNTWHLLEFRVVVDDSSGVAQVKLDGELQIDFSGDTKPSTATTIHQVWLRGIGGSAYHWFDDVALNDTTGGVDDSWPGDGKIIAITPDAAGDSTQWTPSTGANYQNVDERPPNDDTDYNYTSTDGNVDLFNLTSPTLTGIGVQRIIVKGTARKEAANGDQMRLCVKTGGTVYNGSDYGFSTLYSRLQEHWRLNPNTSLAWTQSDLDGLQAGYESRT